MAVRGFHVPHGVPPPRTRHLPSARPRATRDLLSQSLDLFSTILCIWNHVGCHHLCLADVMQTILRLVQAVAGERCLALPATHRTDTPFTC